MRRLCDDIDVLIVGAGPVGLATALELGLHGVESLVVERRDGSIHVPKTTMVSARNMEFCRRWGIAPQVRNKVWDEDRRLDFVYAESLTGAEIARWPTPCYREQRLTAPSPEVATHCPQLYFDPMLKERVARESKASLLYQAQVVDFAEDEDGVRATIERDHERFEMRCRILVACDGAAGLVREKLNIALDGRGDLAQSVNVFFECRDLVSRHAKGWARIYRMIDDGGCWSELIPIDGDRLWRLTVFDEPDAPRPAEDYLRRAFGADIPVRVIDASTWRRRDYVARTYGAGRVFLAGDSAHQCSPTSGLGMATGLEDAVNLGWKIAAALQGWGGHALLASYEQERKPLALRNVSLSTLAFDALRAIPPRHAHAETQNWRDDLAKFSTPEFVKLHYVYETSGICLPDDENAAQAAPLARPGARAPHAWISPGRSSLDLFGPHFTILKLSPGADASPLETAMERLGAPLKTHDASSTTLSRDYGCALALVRPDGHIAWRGAQAGESEAAKIAARACGF
jgi:2-polyprenyl-6-methoxyphenol hydroxylase-like FAD-dependent oxidoreductase